MKELKKSEVILINRYDIRKKLDEAQAHSLVTTMQKDVNVAKRKVMYMPAIRDGKEFTTRMQVPHFDIDEVIKHFETRIKTDDKRFLKSWKRNLAVMKKIKKEKLCKAK